MWYLPGKAGPMEKRKQLQLMKPSKLSIEKIRNVKTGRKIHRPINTNNDAMNKVQQFENNQHISREWLFHKIESYYSP